LLQRKRSSFLLAKRSKTPSTSNSRSPQKNAYR
jgi:hypothetical protein